MEFAGSIMPRTYSANASSCKLKCHLLADAATPDKAGIPKRRNAPWGAMRRVGQQKCHQLLLHSGMLAVQRPEIALFAA